MSRILEGTVRGANTQRRIENATVRLEPAERTGDLKDVEPAFRNTDDDGDFSFDVSDATKWPEGVYTLMAFHADAGPGSAQKSVTLTAGEPPGFHWLELPDTEISNAHGAWFFAGLFIALAALVVTYLLLHEQVTDKPTPLDAELTQTIQLAQAQATEATQLDSSALVVQTINLADSLFQSARQDTSLFSPQKAARTAGLLAQAREASYAGDSTGLGTILHSIEQGLLQPTTPFFWSQLPWRLAEILFWALGATINGTADRVHPVARAGQLRNQRRDPPPRHEQRLPIHRRRRPDRHRALESVGFHEHAGR